MMEDVTGSVASAVNHGPVIQQYPQRDQIIFAGVKVLTSCLEITLCSSYSY